MSFESLESYTEAGVELGIAPKPVAVVVSKNCTVAGGSCRSLTILWTVPRPSPTFLCHLPTVLCTVPRHCPVPLVLSCDTCLISSGTCPLSHVTCLLWLCCCVLSRSTYCPINCPVPLAYCLSALAHCPSWGVARATRNNTAQFLLLLPLSQARSTCWQPKQLSL